MNKTEFVDHLAVETGLNKKQAHAALEATIKVIEDAMRQGEPVRIPGFGVFKVVDRAAREGRNPQTGERIMISARKAVAFKAGLLLKNSVEE